MEPKVEGPAEAAAEPTPAPSSAQDVNELASFLDGAPAVEAWDSSKAVQQIQFDPFSKENLAKMQEEEDKEVPPVKHEGNAGEVLEEDAAAVKAAKAATTAEREAAAAAAAAAATPNPVEQELAAVRTRLEVTEAALKARPAEGAAEKKPEAKPAYVAPTYDFTITDKLAEAFVSEDPVQRKAALADMAKGLATTVHNEVRREMLDVHLAETALAPKIQAVIQQLMHEQQTALAQAQQFYANNKDLNEPTIKPLVTMVLDQIVRETGATTFSAEVQKAVAERTRRLLASARAGAGGGAASPAQAPAVAAPAPKAKPPALTKPGTRTSAPGSNGITGEIMELR